MRKLQMLQGIVSAGKLSFLEQGLGTQFELCRYTWHRLLYYSIPQ